MKLFFVIALTLLGFSAMAQDATPGKAGNKKEQKKPKATGKVMGEIKNMPAQKVVIELLRANDVVSVVDSANAKADGHFELSVYNTEPQLYRLRFTQNRTMFLSVNKEKVKVEGDWNDFDNLKVSGSKSSEDIVTFISTFRRNMMQLNVMKHQMDSLKKAGMDDQALAADKSYEEMRAGANSYLKQTALTTPYEPNAVLAARIVGPQESAFLGDFNKGLSTRFPGTSITKDFNEFYAKLAKGAPQVGEMAPDVVLTTPDGTTASLSSMKGKYVLLDFWASWCGPCRGENPNVVSAYNRFKDKNFTILGVSLDNSKEAWQKAINADGLVWTQVSELKGWSSAVAGEYGVQSIPQNFLIDPTGKIIAHNLRGPELQQTLEQTLK